MKITALTFICLIFSSGYSIAAQYYKIIMTNYSYNSIKIDYIPGICMHVWQVPKQDTELKNGESIEFTIQDKDSGINCIGGEKIAYWNLTTPSKDVGNQIHFLHTKDGKKFWKTSIVSQRSDNIIKSAGCQVENIMDNMVDCNNYEVENVLENAIIKIVF